MRTIITIAVLSICGTFIGCAATTPGRIIVRDKPTAEVYDRIVSLFRPHQDSKLVLMGTEKASGLITVMSKGKAIPATKPTIIQLIISQTGTGTTIDVSSILTTSRMNTWGGTGEAIRAVFDRIYTVFPQAQYSIKNQPWTKHPRSSP